MSHLSFSDNEIISNIPSLPNFGDSLKFIETKKFLPNINQSLFDKNVRQYQIEIHQQNSLQLCINNQIKSQAQCTQPGSTPYKKKRVGCICKKTQCLKMYCQCFASGKMCSPQCVCHGCSNNQKCEDLIEKAKQSIKIKNLTISKKQNDSKGCNCKKSQCQKKYCQCFNAGIACGQICKCQDCANVQGSYTNKSIKQQNESQE